MKFHISFVDSNFIIYIFPPLKNKICIYLDGMQIIIAFVKSSNKTHKYFTHSTFSQIDVVVFILPQKLNSNVMHKITLPKIIGKFIFNFVFFIII